MIILIALTISLLVYGIIKKPSVNIIKDEVEGEGREINFWFLLLIGAVIIIIWLYFRGRDTTQVVPTLSPDDFNVIVKDRLIKKEGVKGYYDEDGDLQYAPDCVIENDQRPFVPAGTGQEFLLKEITIRDPDSFHEPQTRVIMANLNRDKKLLEAGLYAHHEHTTMFDWLKEKSFLKKLPLSSPESEGLQLAQFAAEQEMDLGELQKMRGATRRQYPNEGYEGGYEGGYGGGYQDYGSDYGQEEMIGEGGEDIQDGGGISRYLPWKKKKKPYRRRRR